MSKMRKGKAPWNTGKTLSEEHKQHDREAMLGMLWWSNGAKTVRARVCPGPEFARGRLPSRKRSQ